MENNIENLITELGRAANRITTIYANTTVEEQRNIEKQMETFNMEVGQIFSKYIGVLPRKVIENLGEQIKEEIKKDIQAVSIGQRNTTIENLGNVRADSEDKIVNGIQKFKAIGISKADDFEQRMQEIEKRIEVAYSKVVNQVPTKNNDITLEEIRGSARAMLNKAISLHEDNIGKIEQEILREVEKFEMEHLNHQRQDKEKPSLIDKLKENVEQEDIVAKADAEEWYEPEAPSEEMKKSAEEQFI